jgi:hypothetical protein
MSWAMLMSVVLLMLCACSDNDGLDGGDVETPTVSAHFTFALPGRIVGTPRKASTRMTPDVVQEGKKEAFRGIRDIHLFCYDQYPTENSTKLGKTIDLNTAKGIELEEASETDYSLSQVIQIPVGTTHFAFYGRADDSPRTHEECMKYGVIETVGLGGDYQGNNNIRFRPVPICTSTDELGGSERGHNLLNLLNELMNMTGPEAAPNDKMTTTKNQCLEMAFESLTSFRTLSSFNVQHAIGYLWMMANLAVIEPEGSLLARAIADKIAGICVTPPDPGSSSLTLVDAYQGFPDDIHLPAGAARITWDQEKSLFVVPDTQDYGKGFEVTSMNDYAYPMNLQYQIFSDILASDSLVLIPEDTTDPTTGDPSTPGGSSDDPTSGDPTADPTTDPNADPNTTGGQQYENWADLINDAYGDTPDKTVLPSTQSVAMVQQVEYAVGRLALRTRITTDNCYDAKGQYVDVSKGFTLKGYIVGGQREVDYNFQTVTDSHSYAIYDTNIADTCKDVKRYYWTGYDYILGLGTPSNENIYLALELENNGDAFQGADGVIAHGATFYLVATMDPSKGKGYSFGSLDQIFNKDYATRVNLTILAGWKDRDGDGIPDPDLDEHGNPKPPTGLATATYGMPDMDVPHAMGVSVDLSWSEGLYFDNVIL